MTFVTAMFGRWLRLALALAAALAALLVASQARRWLASDRAWSLEELQRLVRDGATAFAGVLVVASTLAAVEVVVRLRRDGVLATMCATPGGLRRLFAATAAMAGVVGGLVAAAGLTAVVRPDVPVLQRCAEGWRWQPWASGEVVTIAVDAAVAAGRSGAAMAGDGAWIGPLAGGVVGALVVAACVPFAAAMTHAQRWLPHLVVLDALALAAAVWCAEPAAALAALALAGAWSWRQLHARGVRRLA